MAIGHKARLAIALGLGSVASVFSFLDSAGQALSDGAPGLAARFDSGNEIVNQRLANQLLQRPDDPAAKASAKAAVLRALPTAPGQGPLLRNYAFLIDAGVLKGDSAAVMAMAAKFSKRDLPTQLWLIERRAADGDVEGTLAYYDNAMLTNPQVRPLLYPILGRALSDDSLRGPIVALLDDNPVWANGFFMSFAEDKDALLNFPLLLEALGQSGQAQVPVKARVAAASALLKAGELEKAEYVSLLGLSGANVSDFSNGNGTALPPFGWQVFRSGTVSAAAIGTKGLSIEVGSGAGGLAAERLVRVPQGSFRIFGRIQSSAGNAEQLPRIEIQCASARQTSEFIIPKAAGNGQFTYNKVITMPGCTYAEMRVRVPGNFANAPLSANLTELEISQ